MIFFERTAKVTKKSTVSHNFIHFCFHISEKKVIFAQVFEVSTNFYNKKANYGKKCIASSKSCLSA